MSGGFSEILWQQQATLPLLAVLQLLPLAVSGNDVCVTGVDYDSMRAALQKPDIIIVERGQRNDFQHLAILAVASAAIEAKLAAAYRTGLLCIR